MRTGWGFECLLKFDVSSRGTTGPLFLFQTLKFNFVGLSRGPTKELQSIPSGYANRIYDLAIWIIQLRTCLDIHVLISIHMCLSGLVWNVN